ncbi:hypothetical protein RJZ57_000044, partial [Blastomyces gilchristii]
MHDKGELLVEILDLAATEQSATNVAEPDTNVGTPHLATKLNLIPKMSSGAQRFPDIYNNRTEGLRVLSEAQTRVIDSGKLVLFRNNG